MRARPELHLRSVGMARSGFFDITDETSLLYPFAPLLYSLLSSPFFTKVRLYFSFLVALPNSSCSRHPLLTW